MSLVFALYRVHVFPSFLSCVLLLLPPGACMCSSINSNVFAIHRGRLWHSLGTKIGANFPENRRVKRLHVCTASAKRLRGRRELDTELGETVLGGRYVCGHDEYSFQLPAAEMSAAIDVQDVTCDRHGVGQEHDRVRDLLDRRRPTHR